MLCVSLDIATPVVAVAAIAILLMVTEGLHATVCIALVMLAAGLAIAMTCARQVKRRRSVDVLNKKHISIVTKRSSQHSAVGKELMQCDLC